MMRPAYFFWLALLAPAAAAAAEPAFTPRPAPTAIVPALTAIMPDAKARRPNAAAPFLPAPRLPAPISGLIVGGLTVAGLTAGVVAPTAVIAPPPSVTPPSATLPPVVVIAPRLAAAPPTRQTPSPRPTAARAVHNPAVHKKEPPSSRAPLRTSLRTPRAPPDFSAWEGVCLLPEQLPPLATLAHPGQQLRVAVDAFIRVAPDCGARILDVLAAGELVTIRGASDGWYRGSVEDWPDFWIGARLLAPAQQR